MYGDLPESFRQIERRKEFWLIQLLEGVFNPGEGKDNLIAPIIDASEVREEPPTATLLPRQQNWRRERASGMSNDAVSDHLIRLVINGLTHLRPSSISGDMNRGLVLILQVCSVVN